MTSTCRIWPCDVTVHILLTILFVIAVEMNQVTLYQDNESCDTKPCDKIKCSAQIMYVYVRTVCTYVSGLKWSSGIAL